MAKAAAAVILASLACVFLAAKIDKVSRSLQQQRILTLVMEKRSETLSKLKDDFKITGGAEEKINDALPPADNILDFVAALEALAKDNSVVQILSFESPSNLTINYGINISGNVDSLINYLKDFEKLPYFTGVSGLNLTAPNGDWRSNSSATLAAKVYTK